MEQPQRVQTFHMAELVPKGTKAQDEEAQRHDCSALQQQAYEQGRQKGIEEGRAQCQAKVEAELKRVIQLANEIGRARVAALEEQDKDIVEVALTIAQKILLREVKADQELVVRQVRHTLGLLLNNSLVTLKVNPQDLESLQALHQELKAECAENDHLVIEGDDTVEQGGCLVEQSSLQLDARLQQQLETVAMEFGLKVSSS